MKKLLITFLTLISFGLCVAQGYQISVQTQQFKKGIVYLTYYFGSNLNIADSAALSSNGTAIIKGAKKLQGGIYVLVMPDKRNRIEFLLDKEQNILIKIDTTDYVNKSMVTGSKENLLYVQYQKFVAKKGAQLEAEKSAFMQSKTKSDSTLHQKNYEIYNAELTNYRNNIIKTQPNALLTALLNAMKEPSLPIAQPLSRQDSNSNYYYYKNHYWDGVSFMDDRIIRSPFFLKRVETYYKEIIPQSADSIIADIDYKLLLARNSPEMYKFLLNWLTDEYINPKYMGQDAVFVHLFENYHSKGLSNWLNDKQLESISRRAYMLMSNLIGEKAANLVMLNNKEKPTALYAIEADYTVVCFWDPNCGHCKTEIPKLDSIYKANWEKHNVKIFAVLTPDKNETVKKEWLRFIEEKQLLKWTNVYKSKELEIEDSISRTPSFRQLYDVTITPTIYLLDKEKRIIGKKLTIFQINDLLEMKWKTKN